STLRRVLVRRLVPGARGESRVVDGGDIRVLLEPLGKLLRVAHVTLDAQAQRLDALDDAEGAVGRQRRTGVAEQLDAGLDRVRDPIAECARVADPVVAR